MPFTAQEQTVWDDARARHLELLPGSPISGPAIATHFADQAVDRFREEQQRGFVARRVQVRRLADLSPHDYVIVFPRRAKRRPHVLALLVNQVLDVVARRHRRTVEPSQTLRSEHVSAERRLP